MSIDQDFMDDEMMAEMLADFLDESETYLHSLNDGLLQIDELVNQNNSPAGIAVDLELLNAMFRDAHSLKGLSAMLRLNDINRLTHKIENVFDAARNDVIGVSRNVVDTVLQSVDRLTDMIDQLKTDDPQDLDYECNVEALSQLLEKKAELNENECESKTNPVAHAASIETDESLEVDSKFLAKAQQAFNDLVDDDNIPEKYLAMFADETEDALTEISELLEIAGEIDLNKLLAIGHRVKGSAATIGLNRAARLAHVVEDIIQKLKDEKIQPPQTVREAILFAIDRLSDFSLALKNNGPQSDDSTADLNADRFVEACEKLMAAEADLSISEAVIQPGDETGETPCKLNLQAALLNFIKSVDLDGFTARVVTGAVEFAEDLPLIGMKAQLLLERLSDIGRVISCVPPEKELDDVEELRFFSFLIETDENEAALMSRLQADGVTDCLIVEPEKVDLFGQDDLSDSTIAQPTNGSDESSAVNAKEHPIGDSQVAQMPTATVTNPPETEDSVARKPTPEAAQSGSAVVSEPPLKQASGPANDAAAKSATRESVANVPKGSGESKNPNSDAAKTERPIETIRVDIDRLDHLMNQAGQLVINKARFSRIGDQFKSYSKRKHTAQSVSNATAVLNKLEHYTESLQGEENGKIHAANLQTHLQELRLELDSIGHDVAQLKDIRLLVNDLGDAVHQLDRVSEGIQKSVMDTRMVTIGPLFSRFKRVVRDYTKGSGKDIRLVIKGDKTELDKRMIDELGDPLIHMVRNSADHGIETPEERRQRDKLVQGTITLDAFHRGNQVFIQVKDDGRGLDPEKIKSKAISKGIISQDDAERLSHHQAFQLIWEPGFSTAEKITEISGRGMGMDIVHSKLEKLNGTVEIDSTLHQGTTITIKLPLTMAILPSLLTVIDDDVFAIPVETVHEIVQVNAEQFSTVHGARTALIRGRVVSVIELNQLLNFDDTEHEAVVQRDETLVIIGSKGQELGLVVDGLLGEEDIVIKSLAENYRNVLGFAGASILGDGRVSLILDVAAIIDMSCNQ